MPMMMMAMIGLQAGQALLGAHAAKTQAAAAQLQFEEAEFQRRWQNQVENRNIAKKNALRWFNNSKIAEAANTQRAEEEFYIRYNWDNQAGAYGNQHKATQDELYSRITGKGIDPKSGTARAILRQQNETTKNLMADLRINTSNQLIGAERRQDQALAGRDFGYNASIPFMPGSYGGPSAGDAFSQSLQAGLVGGAANTLGYLAMIDAPTAGTNTTNYSLINVGGD